MVKLIRSLWELIDKDPIKVITAIVATIITIIGIVAQEILIAVLGILVILDLLAISQLITGSVTLTLDRRAQEAEERVKLIEGASVETLELVRNLNVEMLNEARAVGIVDIFAKRKDDERARLAVVAALEKVQGSGGNVDLLGIALPDYLLRTPFVKFMTNYVRYAGFRALLLHPASDAAKHRERIERGLAATITDIELSSGAIQRFLEENRRVQGRLYSIAPMVFLIITDDCIFIEPYHLGKVGPSVDCIGGRVPFLKIAPVPDIPPLETDTYTIMKNHFTELWNNSERIEIPLSIEFRRQHDRYSLTLTRPEDVERPLDLSDWTLKRDGSPDVYSFPPGTILGNGEGVTVMLGPENDTDEIKYTNADLWLEGDNLVLRNTAGSRTRTFRITRAG